MKAIQVLIHWSFPINHINYSQYLQSSDLPLYKSCFCVYTLIYGQICYTGQHRYSLGWLWSMWTNWYLVKGLLDAVGLTKNVAVLRRWISTGPQISLLILKFKGCTHLYMDQSFMWNHTKYRLLASRLLGTSTIPSGNWRIPSWKTGAIWWLWSPMICVRMLLIWHLKNVWAEHILCSGILKNRRKTSKLLISLMNQNRDGDFQNFWWCHV